MNMHVRLAYKNMRTEVIDVSPSVAQAWMDRNENNRKPSSKIVAAYARDMKNGKWLSTGDAIRFDQEGKLIDGQHRLMACIEADVPFRTVVIYGLPSETQKVIDTGKARRAADMLQLDGYQNVSVLNTAARWIIHYKAGHEATNILQPSHSEIMACVLANRKLAGSATIVANVQFVHKGLLAFLHYVGVAYLKDPEKANAFVDVFKTGVPSSSNCPAHRARERLIRERRYGGKGEEGVLNRQQHYRLLTHTFNLFMSGSHFERLMIPDEVEIEGLDRAKLRTE